MIAYLLAQLALVVFNLINSRIDAYRIMANKTIAHGINLFAYSVFVALLYLLFRYGIGDIIVFGISAFTNRQFSFDIPLNLKRGLKWHHVSTAKPPKALLDRIEIRVFGYNGRAPLFVYAVVWVACLIVKIFI